MKTTLNKIRAHAPCADGWTKLLTNLGKTSADDEPLDLLTILDSNGLDDTMWCFRAVDGHDREMRLFSVWCARQVQHLMNDQRNVDALNVAERFANGHASIEELDAARAAANAAAAGVAAGAVAWATATAAARAAADAATAAARVARDVAGVVGDVVWVVWGARAAAGAAGDAASVAQENHLREILRECGK